MKGGRQRRTRRYWPRNSTARLASLGAVALMRANPMPSFKVGEKAPEVRVPTGAQEAAMREALGEAGKRELALLRGRYVVSYVDKFSTRFMFCLPTPLRLAYVS